MAMVEPFVSGIVRSVEWTGHCDDVAVIRFLEIGVCRVCVPHLLGTRSRRFLVGYQVDGRRCYAVARGGRTVGQFLYGEGLGGRGEKLLPDLLDPRGRRLDKGHLVDELSSDVVYEVAARPGPWLTALCEASGRGDVKVLSRYQGKALDPMVPGDPGPLHIAVLHCPQVVTYLLNRGASLDAQGPGGTTPLTWAVELGRFDVSRLLVRRGAKLDSLDWGGSSPLMRASDKGDVRMVRLLVELGATIDLRGRNDITALWVAAKAGHVEVVHLLIAGGAAVDAWDKTGNGPLHVAAGEDRVEVVRELLAAGATQRNSWGESPLWVSVEEGHAETVRELLKNGAKTGGRSVEGQTVLHLSVCMGFRSNKRLDIIRLLLEGGANPDEVDARGQTPLWVAAFLGWSEAVQLLASRSSDSDKADELGVTPLEAALRERHWGVVAELRKWGLR